MALIDSEKNKTYTNKINKNVKVAEKVITITDKLLLKKIQREGGNVGKSSLRKKRYSDVMTKKDFYKYKNK